MIPVKAIAVDCGGYAVTSGVPRLLLRTPAGHLSGR
jgi:hypothetical protein